jgi:6-hydroxycyclohex-1-ene-1-carbonyl-CoA dehydrogenase
MMEAVGYFAQPGGGALVRQGFTLAAPAADEVIVAVDACGLCHTDLGFARAQVAPRHALPLVLGHEIVGRVLHAGESAKQRVGDRVLVPAVMPCGRCAYCLAGRGNACPTQKMPGNDIHGGFASHLVVPSAPLVDIPTDVAEVEYRAMSVVADAVSTAWQAVLRAKLAPGDIAVVVGAGGVGGFLVQIAAAVGAHVIACDVSPARLEKIAGFGAAETCVLAGDDVKTLRKQVQGALKARGATGLQLRVFECSGHTGGQNAAWSLMSHGSTTVFVGYTMDKLSVRLSNLMAYDATAMGTWGCPVEAYAACLDMVRDGRVKLLPFLEEAPMSRLNECLDAMDAHALKARMVLLPET